MDRKIKMDCLRITARGIRGSLLRKYSHDLDGYRRCYARNASIADIQADLAEVEAAEAELQALEAE